jgi:hypothetical protein
MALADISAEQFQALAPSILSQPPPAPIQRLTLPTESARLIGQQMRGSRGSIIEQIERRKQQMAEDALAQQAADALNQINPMDPGYADKIRQIQTQTGQVFNSPVVRAALQTSGMVRDEFLKGSKEQSERLAEQRKAQIAKIAAKGTPEQINQIWEADPEAAVGVLPIINKREQGFAEAESYAAKTPDHYKEGLDMSDPNQAKLAYSKFQTKVPPQLRKIADVNTIADIADTAKRLMEIEAKIPKDAEIPEDVMQMQTDLRSRLETLGAKGLSIPELANLSEVTQAPGDRYNPAVKRSLEALAR